MQPTADDPRALRAVEAHAFAAADAFTPVTLSPVAPLGLNVVLGDIDQNSTLAALRNCEVLADPTTVLALETARARPAGDVVVRRCAAGRMLRMQPFDNPAFSPHFALFALTSGGRARADHGFEVEALVDHLTAHLALYQRLAGDGYRLADLRVEIADTDGDEARLGRRRGARLPDPARALFRRDLRHRSRAHPRHAVLPRAVPARDRARSRRHVHQLSDGGATDWLARLTANGKLRFFASGLGSELLLRRFR